MRRFTITIPGDEAEAIEFSSGVIVACWTDPARLYAWEDIKALRDQMPDAEISWLDQRGEAR